jgi:hypothetical protein
VTDSAHRTCSRASSAVEALYQPEHAENPVILASPGDVDAVLDALIADTDGHDMAQLICRERPVHPGSRAVRRRLRADGLAGIRGLVI